MGALGRATPRTKAWLNLRALIVAGMFATGCADNRPPYVEPMLVPGETVSLTGGWGYYVTEVDETRVDSGNVTFSLGGNNVRLTPGEHRLCIHWQGPNSWREWRFKCVFWGGHAYQFGAVNLVNTNLEITDTRTKQSIRING